MGSLRVSNFSLLCVTGFPFVGCQTGIHSAACNVKNIMHGKHFWGEYL